MQKRNCLARPSIHCRRQYYIITLFYFLRTHTWSTNKLFWCATFSQAIQSISVFYYALIDVLDLNLDVLVLCLFHRALSEFVVKPESTYSILSSFTLLVRPHRFDSSTLAYRLLSWFFIYYLSKISSVIQVVWNVNYIYRHFRIFFFRK